MIVEFSVSNFRSIQELQTLSFVATGLKSPEQYLNVDEDNVSEDGGLKLLKTVGIYGANASGKSNIIRALEYFIQAIKSEASTDSNLGNLCDPFLYQSESFLTESFFQIVLVVKNKKYRYGFTVKKNPFHSTVEKDSKEIIVNEWLYGTKDKNSGAYFTRKELDVTKEKILNGDKIPDVPYKHTLFLTHAAAFDKESVCTWIREFFKGWTISNFINGLEHFRWNSLYLLENEKKKTDLLELLSSFNLRYDDITIDRDKSKPENDVVPHDKITFTKQFNKNDKPIEIKLNLRNNESEGTQKLFDIAGLLLRAFNMPVSVFVILDEVDSNFHPALLIKLIKLFNTPAINKSKSQLLFTSHDTNLMHPSIMRRDQFYLTEKKDNNSTRLYSLSDLKGIRNDADFAKQYLAGYYGALPVLEEFMKTNPDKNEGTLEH